MALFSCALRPMYNKSQTITFPHTVRKYTKSQTGMYMSSTFGRFSNCSLTLVILSKLFRAVHLLRKYNKSQTVVFLHKVRKYTESQTTTYMSLTVGILSNSVSKGNNLTFVILSKEIECSFQVRMSVNLFRKYNKSWTVVF